MAVISPQQVSIAGTNATYTAVTASDTFGPDTGQVLHVKNASGGSVTVTFVDAGRTPGGSAATNPTVSVPAAGDRFIGPVPQSYASQSTGLITVNYSATTSVTAALLKV
jgi:hypothetical protein